MSSSLTAPAIAFSRIGFDTVFLYGGASCERGAREESHNEPEEESKGSIYERMMASLDEVRLDRYDRAMNA